MGQVMDRAQQLQDGYQYCAITVVSLQDSGVTRYAIGTARGGGGKITADLTESFSDRFVDLPSNGPFRDENPFSKNNTDASTLAVDLHDLKASMVLHTWGDATFSFGVNDQGDVLFGVGDPAGGSSNRAYYLIALGAVMSDPH